MPDFVATYRLTEEASLKMIAAGGAAIEQDVMVAQAALAALAAP
jgi:hypothetical protein